MSGYEYGWGCWGIEGGIGDRYAGSQSGGKVAPGQDSKKLLKVATLSGATGRNSNRYTTALASETSY